MSKRPWKKRVGIRRITFNSGDVKFMISHREQKFGNRPCELAGTMFESLTEAEAALDAWWADWWPKQIKHASNA